MVMSTNDPQRPRSTPIPSGEDFLNAPAPTSGEFLGSPSPVPGGRGPAGPAGPTPFAQPGTGMPFGTAPPPGAPAGQFGAFGQGFPGGPVPVQAMIPRQRRSGCGTVFWVFIILSILGGIGAAVWGVFVAKDAVDRANEISDPELSGGDREALGLPDDVETLFEGGGAAAVVQAFEDAIGQDPLMVTEILIYSDYAFAEVQNPAAPTNLDRYGWRAGEVDEPDPQRNEDDLESKLFSTDAVAWAVIPALAEGSPAALGIGDGEVTHIIITRGFNGGEPVIRVYVNSPRDSGYLEARASTGEVLAGF